VVLLQQQQTKNLKKTVAKANLLCSQSRTTAPKRTAQEATTGAPLENLTVHWSQAIRPHAGPISRLTTPNRAAPAHHTNGSTGSADPHLASSDGPHSPPVPSSAEGAPCEAANTTPVVQLSRTAMIGSLLQEVTMAPLWAGPMAL